MQFLAFVLFAVAFASVKIQPAVDSFVVGETSSLIVSVNELKSTCDLEVTMSSPLVEGKTLGIIDGNLLKKDVGVEFQSFSTEMIDELNDDGVIDQLKFFIPAISTKSLSNTIQFEVVVQSPAAQKAMLQVEVQSSNCEGLSVAAVEYQKAELVLEVETVPVVHMDTTPVEIDVVNKATAQLFITPTSNIFDVVVECVIPGNAFITDFDATDVDIVEPITDGYRFIKDTLQTTVDEFGWNVSMEIGHDGEQNYIEAGAIYKLNCTVTYKEDESSPSVLAVNKIKEITVGGMGLGITNPTDTVFQYGQSGTFQVTLTPATDAQFTTPKLVVDNVATCVCYSVENSDCSTIVNSEVANEVNFNNFRNVGIIVVNCNFIAPAASEQVSATFSSQDVSVADAIQKSVAAVEAGIVSAELLYTNGKGKIIFKLNKVQGTPYNPNVVVSDLLNCAINNDEKVLDGFTSEIVSGKLNFNKAVFDAATATLSFGVDFTGKLSDGFTASLKLTFNYNNWDGVNPLTPIVSTVSLVIPAVPSDPKAKAVTIDITVSGPGVTVDSVKAQLASIKADICAKMAINCNRLLLSVRSGSVIIGATFLPKANEASVDFLGAQLIANLENADSDIRKSLTSLGIQVDSVVESANPPEVQKCWDNTYILKSEECPEEEEEGGNGGAIAGGIIGALVVIGAIVGGCYYFKMKKEGGANAESQALTDSTGTTL